MTPAQPALTLPPVAAWRVTWTALRPQRLPSLVTTALHGAFDDAVRTLGDPALYATLCRPPPLPAGARGATTHAPSAVVFSPEHYDSTQRYIDLEEGDTVAVRVTLVGEAALAQQAAMDAAMRSVGLRGMGINPRHPDGPRPGLRYERPRRLVPPAVPTGETVRMVLETPTQLVARGKVLGGLETEGLWRAIARRADLLARAHAVPPEGLVLPRAAPFAATASSTRRVKLVRWSGSQETRMTWQGLTGSVTLAGESLASLGPLLGFIAQVGVGKHTSFGLGRVAFGE